MASSSANIWVMLGLGLAGTILLMTQKLKKTVKEDFGAFIQKLKLLPPPQPAPPKAPHPLTNLTFAVSDLIDIEGHVTGFGNPDWARTHQAASRTASVVSTLVDGGATCIGKTIIDEMAYSVIGENKHYGTPTNPGVHDRIPGGSCSGAAVSVAANLVDFSLGIDAIGGVRLPSGFCGVIGFRASHGSISQSGIIPISPSLDTIGFCAKDPDVLRRAVHVVMKLQFAAQRSPRQIIIADDCFELIKLPVDQVIQPVIRSTEKLFGRQVLKHENLGAYLSSKVSSLLELSAKKNNNQVKTSTINLLAHMMQSLLRYEFKENHGEWINSVKPDVGASIRALFHEGNVIDESEIQKMHRVKTEMRLALNSLLKDDGLLVIPTFADPPQKVGGKEMSSETYLNRFNSLQSIASLSGCCQVTIPLGYHNKCPLSVSFIAKHGGDRFLLDIVQTMYSNIQEQVEVVSKSKSTSNSYSRERSAELAKEKGNQAFKEKQWQKAIGFYGEAIKLYESNATYYSNRAAAYLELGSFVQAEVDCTKAIELDRKNVKAYLRRGTAREMLGYYKEAIEDFRYALVLEPTNKRAAVSMERLKNLFQ
ncbi:outer envelope protein 64, chloroplastic-like [Chenopodium quinoa]|uniref:outer envelope protein 64, chloroplastic-like n=1 Tax=Chenopodium quinoa TaxID=63459 RepID=UPI000B793728|nr:outer envelope protein 64, chloroplastic-like [Chenopodium quinoa]